MDPIVVDGGTLPQKGGLDPGMAALIAAILTGSVGSYGYLNNKESPEAVAEAKLKDQIEAANKTVAAAKDATRAKQEVEAKLKLKEAELATLKSELERLRKSATSTTEVAEIFKTASTDTLNRSVPKVLVALGFRSDGSDAPEIKKALLYPGSYQGRLMRMSLYDFYSKRFKPAFEKDTTMPKGGRRRRAKRGGDSMNDELAAIEGEPAQPLGPPGGPGTAASYGRRVPSYDEFAKLYTDAIKSTALTPPPTVKQAKVTEKAPGKPDKKDEAAVKASRILADKLQKVIKDADKEIAKYDQKVKSVEAEGILAKLTADIADAKVRSEQPIPTKPLGYTVQTGPMESEEAKEYEDDVKAKSLRLVKTEAEWNVPTMKDAAQELLTKIPQGVKDYVKALKNAPKDKSSEEVAKAPTGPTSIHDKLLTETPVFLKKVSGLNDEVKGMIKGLDTEMKQIPKPEQYKGGCAVKVLVEEMQDILRKISTVIGRRSASLQKAVDDYKKETKGTPIYDSSLQRSESEETELATSKSSIDRAVAGINEDTETLFATVERMKGGARALQKVFDLRDQIDLGVYALKRFSANIIGLKDSYETLLRIIEKTRENRLATPAEWEEEKKSCPGQVEELKKKVYRLPTNVGEVEGTELVQNPMFGPKKPGAPPPSPAVTATTATGEPGTPTSTSRSVRSNKPRETISKSEYDSLTDEQKKEWIVLVNEVGYSTDGPIREYRIIRRESPPPLELPPPVETAPKSIRVGKKKLTPTAPGATLPPLSALRPGVRPEPESNAQRLRAYAFPRNKGTKGTVKRRVIDESPPNTPTAGGYSRKRTLKKRRGGK